MNKKMLFTGALALMMSLGASAQTAATSATQPKWDGMLNSLMLRAKTSTSAASSNKGGQTALVEVLIKCTDAEAVAKAIEEANFKANAVTDNVATAEIPLQYIPTLAEMPEVLSIRKSTEQTPYLTESRMLTNADQVHAGEGLETPFTGKGVIVGVIDQGFEYKHIAFQNADGTMRVKSFWNHQKNTNKPTTTIPTGGDGLAGGHGTHVMNIAAGSKIPENDYYGFAPDADLVMVSSRLSLSNVLDEAKHIRDFAIQEGKPWVTNMSFGSLVGPHDGTSLYSQTLDQLCKKGGFFVVANGNDGNEKLHASYTFTQDGEVKYLLFNPSPEGAIVVDIWGQAGDGKKHLNVEPYTYDKAGVGSMVAKLDAQDANFWNSVTDYIVDEVDSENQKEHYQYGVVASILQNYTSKNHLFCLKITGKAGQTFHAWINTGQGSFATATGMGTSAILKGDNKYCITNGGCTKSAIAVGAYTAGTSWNDLNGEMRWYSGYRTQGAICDFSNIGPSLDPEYPRPTITGPGACIKSALSSYSDDFSANSTSLVSCVERGNIIKSTKYYYGIMMGTSMSTPAVTGIIACWLQAYPDLTREQIEEVFKKTSIRDKYTGSDEWNEIWGYGKIDAYAGIKEVLNLANGTGINAMLNSEAPVTLSKGIDTWRILFNNDESYANITLHTTDGMQVYNQSIDNPRRGQEEVLNLNNFTPGIYLVNIKTTAGNLTRKVIVR